MGWRKQAARPQRNILNLKNLRLRLVARFLGGSRLPLSRSNRLLTISWFGHYPFALRARSVRAKKYLPKRGQMLFISFVGCLVVFSAGFPIPTSLATGHLTLLL